MQECPKCGKQLKPNSNFCGNCGADLRESSWGVEAGELARLYEVNDVPGWFSRPLTIKAGQKALIFVNGSFEGVVPSGVVDMGGVKQRILSLGRARTMQAVIVHDHPTTVEFSLVDVRTADGLHVNTDWDVTVRIENEMVFYRNAMGSQKVYEETALRRTIFKAFSAAVARGLADVPMDEIREGPRALRELERSVGQELTQKLAGLGFSVGEVTVASVQHEGLDLLDKKREKRRIDEMNTVDEIEAEETDYALDRRRATQEIRRESAEVEDTTRRLDVLETMRRALLKGRMEEKRAAQDEADFDDQVQRQGVLRDDDMADFLAESTKRGLLRADEVFAVERAIAEDNQDHDNDRQHAITLLTIRQAREVLASETDLAEDQVLAQIRLLQPELEKQGIIQSGRHELDLRELNHQLTVRETEFEQQLRMHERARGVELKDRLDEAKTQAEVDTIEHSTDMREMSDLIEIKRQKDAAKQEAERREAELAEELRTAEHARTLQAEQAAHEHEMERVRTMAEMPIDQLMAIVDDNERAAILADVKKMEITAGMTDEQILAQGAKDSPEVADAIKAKFVAMADAKGAQELQALTEKMVESEKAHGSELREVYEANAERARQHAEKTLETIADVARSSSSSGGTTVVLPTGQVVQPGAPAAPAEAAKSEPVVLCRNCRHEVPAGDKFCPNCGETM